MADWPSALNDKAWLLDGYSLDVNPQVVRSNPASGRSRQRRDLTCRDAVFSVGMVLNDVELDLFETFYFDSISRGADLFNGPFYDGSGQRRTGQMQIVGGQYSTQRIIIGIYKVTMQILVIDREQQNKTVLADLFSGSITYNDYLLSI